MPKTRVTPQEVYALVERLEARSKSLFTVERPEVQKDMALAAKILRTLLFHEVISAPMELE